MSFDALESKLLRAKIELMSKSVFISTISLNVKHLVSDLIPTAATNGLKIWYNPKFIEKMSVQQLAGLMAHECWHIGFQHQSRMGSRDKHVWNIAGDIVINNMLLDNGYSIPPTECKGQEYKDMSTEQVYDALMKEAKDNIPNLSMPDLDAPEGAEKEQELKVRDIIVKAHTQSKVANKSKGEIPEEIARHIEELLNPTLPWQDLLYRFINETVKDKYTWNRKNRRFETYLPSMYSKGLSHLTFAIDTSGSVSDNELQELLTEIDGIKQTFNPAKMTIIDCDCKINNIYECNENTNIKDLEFTGGGGTSFIPVLDYVKDNPTQALIYFTDLWAEKIVEEQGYPIMWICNSNHSPMPIGETIYLDKD